MTAEPDGRREAERRWAREEYVELCNDAARALELLLAGGDGHAAYDAIERAILARLALQETEGK